MATLTEDARRRAYYRAALGLLRHVERRAPTTRRFGSEADALWRSFAGDLDAGDRIELLLRDADRQWPGAFGARAVFALRSAHEQDAFGSRWVPLGGGEAEAMWTAALAEPPADDPIAALLRCWELEPASFAAPPLKPSARVVIAGLAAIVACLRQCLANPDLSWPNQVVVVAAEPGPRQLAAAAVALLDHNQPSLLVEPAQLGAAQIDVVRAQLGPVLEPIISPDASPAEREAVARLTAPAKPKPR
jgi:hypothetical protein